MHGVASDVFSVKQAHTSLPQGPFLIPPSMKKQTITPGSWVIGLRGNWRWVRGNNSEGQVSEILKNRLSKMKCLGSRFFGKEQRILFWHKGSPDDEHFVKCWHRKKGRCFVHRMLKVVLNRMILKSFRLFKSSKEAVYEYWEELWT